MPIQAQDSLLDDLKPKQEKQQKKEQFKHVEEIEPREVSRFLGDIPEGVAKLIAEGDHMASLLRRVEAGMHTPQRTIDKALDEWDNLAYGFELEEENEQMEASSEGQQGTSEE